MEYGSLKIKKPTFDKLKEFVGETGKINAHAEKAIQEYIERNTPAKSPELFGEVK